MKKKSFYPVCAGELTEEERIAVCKALYPEQANKTPENRALWPKDRLLTAAEKMAWSRYVRRPPATRYDVYPAYGRKYGALYRPTDPILWALRMHRAGLARRLLEEKGPLDWVDASRYAPWTLRWSPSLLKLILDLAPAGEPLGCCHRFTRTGGDWKICVNATLLTAAAALDDIESVELLLEYGYDPAPEFDQYGDMLPKEMHLRYAPKRDYDGTKDWYQRHSTLPLDIRTISVEHVLFLIPTDEGFAKGLSPPYPHAYFCDVYISRHFQPLSAALLCGASRCALRLLEYPRAPASEHAQIIASYLADFGIPPFRETLDIVMDALGSSPEQFVEPGNWANLHSRRHLVCLRKHDFYTIDRNGARRDCVVDLMGRLWDEQSFAKAAELPVERLNRALMGLIRSKGRSSYSSGYEKLAEFQERQGITLTLDRDGVLPGTCWYQLLRALDYVVAGPPPEDHLSAAARLFLNAMLLEPPLREPSYVGFLGKEPGLDPMYEITHSEKAIRLLTEERFPLVKQTLEEIETAHPECAQEVYFLLGELMTGGYHLLLGLSRNEKSYERFMADTWKSRTD